VRTPLEICSECCETPLGQTAENPHQTLEFNLKLTVGGWFT